MIWATYQLPDGYMYVAWGADDTGVEIEYTSRELAMVNGMYDHWKKYIYDKVPNGVNRTWFFEHGFYRA